jgi:predicted RNA binding protein YcfA (HicA-like mRNA interferase family)
MPSERVTPRDISIALKKLGFREKAKRGSHVLYQHPGTDLILILPTGQRYVPLIIIRTIERSLENFDIVKPREFQKILNIEI